ncbi:MAG: GGDEF domain-containing protein [Lachnospiraceae bacterium]|nr:GGDEF domain-containing protein [Lachnospiraceae bacterium]
MASQNEKTVARLNKSRIAMLIISVVITVTVVFVLIGIVLNAAGRVTKSKVSTLVAANSRQIQLNIDKYMMEIKSAAMLMFSNESYYKFDNTDASIDEYDRIQASDNVFNRIVDIGIMKSFSDFVILYSDGTSIGWRSNTTAALFDTPTGLYDYFSGAITNPHTNDGWVFGVQENYNRFYYVKRLNENAVLLVSCYSRELSGVFEHSDELKDMTVRFVDDNERIIYSSDVKEIGNVLQADISGYINGRTDISVTNDDYFIEVNSCDNGWNVICSFESDAMLKDYNRFRNIAMTVTAVGVLLVVLISILVQSRVYNPVKGMVSGLADRATYDGLSGAVNRASFIEYVKDSLESKKAGKDEIVFFAMTDIDNFKKVNDNLGHAYGDEVISRMAKLIDKQFGERITVGRMGGDEFALFTIYKNTDENEVIETIRSDIEKMRTEFRKEFSQEAQSCDVTLSIGLCVGKRADENNFDALYRKADKALYVSKETGKDKVTWYDSSIEEAEV